MKWWNYCFLCIAGDLTCFLIWKIFTDWLDRKLKENEEQKEKE